MFDESHYVPILKGKEGEFGALSQLPDRSKEALTPLVEIPPIPWDFGQQIPSRSIDEHLKRTPQKLARAWGSDRELFLDFLWIGESERMESGGHPVKYLFDAVCDLGLLPIPVIGLMRSSDYLAACSDVVRRDGRGVCVRIQREDFQDFPEFEAELQKVLKSVSAQQGDADLLLDLKALTPGSGEMSADEVLALISSIPDLERWRSFTLAATSFPESLIGLPPSDFSFIARNEWNLWREVVRMKPKRIPTFGDYAISHPQPSEVDPRIMRPSASVRYTAESYWLVPKARNLKDHGYDQFHDVCRDLVERDEYSGRRFSWGDGYIDDCANDRVGCGNLTTWRKVGTSHHLNFVLRQVASSPAI